MNLRPSGYEGDFTQPADGRRHLCFQSFRGVVWAGSPPKSTLGSTSPLEFGQDLVKVPGGHPSNRRPSPWQFGRTGFPNFHGVALSAQGFNFTRDGHAARSTNLPYRTAETRISGSNWGPRRSALCRCYRAAARGVHGDRLHALRPWTAEPRPRPERDPNRASRSEGLLDCSPSWDVAHLIARCSQDRSLRVQITGTTTSLATHRNPLHPSPFFDRLRASAREDCGTRRVTLHGAPATRCARLQAGCHLLCTMSPSRR